MLAAALMVTKEPSENAQDSKNGANGKEIGESVERLLSTDVPNRDTHIKGNEQYILTEVQMRDSVKLTRREYDSLLDNHSDWIKENWLKFRREWSISGVRVFAKPELLQELRQLNPNHGKLHDTAIVDGSSYQVYSLEWQQEVPEGILKGNLVTVIDVTGLIVWQHDVETSMDGLVEHVIVPFLKRTRT